MFRRIQEYIYSMVNYLFYFNQYFSGLPLLSFFQAVLGLVGVPQLSTKKINPDIIKRMKMIACSQIHLIDTKKG